MVKWFRSLWDRLFGYKCHECGKLTTNIRTVPYVGSSYYGKARLVEVDYCVDCKPNADLIVNEPWSDNSMGFYHFSCTQPITSKFCPKEQQK